MLGVLVLRLLWMVDVGVWSLFRAMSILRTFLILGRVSNLPTVWSNCLAGWWLGGGGEVGNLPFLFIGATLLYLGGMFLNDACDAEFDRQHRRERPFPSGGGFPPKKRGWGGGRGGGRGAVRVGCGVS